jgi:hypothetical protein
MSSPEFERVLLAYQDRLRTWGLLATQRAWARMDLERITATFPAVAAQAQAIYATATAEALTVADEYMTVKAAASGLSYVGSWTLADRKTAPLELPSGAPYRSWIAAAQWRMLADIGAGMAAEEASALSLTRTINAMGTSVYNGPRQTTWNRFLVDSLEAAGDVIPPDLQTFYDEVEAYANSWDGVTRREYRGTWERWRRVPSPGACAFCLMLATRSDYTSREAAMYAGGGEGQVRRTTRRNKTERLAGVQRRRSSKQESGERYHRACRCTVAMSTAGDNGQSIQLPSEEIARLTTRDAKGNLPQFKGYTVADFDVVEATQGIRMPERARWADAWKAAPRVKKMTRAEREQAAYDRVFD